MLNEICATIKNYFSCDDDRHIGDFSIVDGQITPSIDILDGQYYRIVGSIFNDGVHQFLVNPPEDFDDILKDEPEFHGAVWLMRVPQDVIDVANNIQEWQEKYGGIDNQSPYQSESFGGYSYNKASSGKGTTGTSWADQEAFMSRLRKYRRIRVL